MKALDLALRYMEIFYAGHHLEALGILFTDDLIFEGPLYQFTSAEDYLDSLRQGPPEEMSYEIIKAFADETSACLIYQFSKAGISVPMAQLFEIEGDKICKITLIFDTGAFTI